MTAQQPDILLNDYNAIDFEDLGLFGVLTSHPRQGAVERYRLRTRPLPPGGAITTTALWRGYRTLYRLTDRGRLVHEGYQYETSSGYAVQQAGEDLTGNFWLQMRQRYFGQNIYIPFPNGLLKKDRDQWILDPGVLHWW